jgi:hypothetical protein
MSSWHSTPAFEALGARVVIRRTFVSVCRFVRSPTASGGKGNAVVTLRYRGGMSRGTDCRWEINGTEGYLTAGMPR